MSHVVVFLGALLLVPDQDLGGAVVATVSLVAINLLRPERPTLSTSGEFVTDWKIKGKLSTPSCYGLKMKHNNIQDIINSRKKGGKVSLVRFMVT